MKLKLLIAGLVVLFGAGGILLFSRSETSTNQRTTTETTEVDEANPNSETQDTTADPGPPRTVRIAAMGDMLPHDTVNLRAEVGDSYDYTPFFTNVRQHIAGSDIVFCNQESPSAGEAFGITGYPSFNAPAEFSRDLEQVGCNVINLANNHIADKGQDAIDGTLDTWDALSPLAVSGANRTPSDQQKVAYFEAGGRTFAFIAFTDLSNNNEIPAHSVNMFGDSLVRDLSREAASKADYVIASAHWGVEDSSTVTVGQENWAQLMADNGVDLIIGTGPHVIQPADKIDDTVVFYSLGNFLSTQLTIEQLTGGIAYIEVPVEGDPTLSFMPTYMSYTWTADQAAAEDLLSRNNLNLYPLDDAGSRIESSLFNTTAEAQIKRISDLLNQNTEVTILESN